MFEFTWSIDPALYRIGSFEIRYYSLIFVLVFLGGYALFNWQVRRGGGDEEDAGDFIIYGVLGVLLGARLGHVLFYDLDHALQDPVWVLKIWTGGLASHGAVVGLIIAMWLYTRRRGIPFLEGSDRFAFSAALGAALVRVGNFFNSEIVGRVTDQTWGVRFPRHDAHVDVVPLRHPSQIYEALWGFAVLGALYLLDKALGREKRPRGAMISAFFVLYFIGRFLVEFVKEYQVLDPETSPLTMGQYLSIPGVLLGAYGLYWSFKRKLPARWDSAPVSRDEDDGDDEEEEDEDGTPAGSDEKGVDPDVEAEFGKGRPKRPSEED